MKSIEEQIKEQKASKKQYLDELFFVDYCNNCKTGLASKNDVPCHHSWYCWHEGESAEIQAKLVQLELKKRDNGRLTAKEYDDYHKLKTKQYGLVKKGLRGRKRIKHKIRR